MTIEVKIEKERYDKKAEVSVNDTDYFGSRAKIVVELISKWGIVAAVPDGEDRKGRSKLRLMEPDELISRAFTIADKMFNEFEMRQWMIQVPDFETRDLAVQNILEEKENNEQANQ